MGSGHESADPSDTQDHIRSLCTSSYIRAEKKRQKQEKKSGVGIGLAKQERAL